MSKVLEKQPKYMNNNSNTNSANNKSSVNTETTNIDDFMSSVSNPDSNDRKFSNQPEVNNLGIINLRNKNLNHHGAYLLSQRVKRDFTIIQTIDLSDNQLQDEGVLYLSLPLRLCTVLNSLNLSNNGITEYGVRILLENLNYRYLKYLNLSGNLIGNKGIEHISKYIPSIQIEHLALNSTGIEEEGAKAIGFALMSSNWLKIIELSWNNIKQNGAVLLCRGLIGNHSVEEIYLSYNSNFGNDGAIALSECLKMNKNLKLIDLSNTKINLDGAKAIATGLKVNSKLKSLNLSYNNVTGAGIYEILKSINTENSNVEYLGLKSIPIQKHLVLIIELIQQRRKFNCEYGNMIMYPDSINVRTSSDDESMIKLARYLSEKRMRLIDLFRILDKSNKMEMDKTEFIRRMKLFEPRLTQKDLHNIASNLSKKDTIYYSTLFTQMTKPKPDNQFELNRKKAQLNEEEERFLNKYNKNISLKKIGNENKSNGMKSNSKAESKFKEIDNWLESQNMGSNGSDFVFDSEKDLKKTNEISNNKKVKFPIIKKSLVEKVDQRFSKSDPQLNKENEKEVKVVNSTSRLSVNKETKSTGRFSSQSQYLNKSKKNDDRKMKRSHENLGRKSVNSDTLKPINEFMNKNTNLTNQRKSINLQSIESGLL